MGMTVETILRVMTLGLGATLLMDGWGLLRRRLFGIAVLDYALVGRWLGHMRHGQFRHTAIGKAPAVHGEKMLGWAFHYLTGLAFAAVFVLLVGGGWLQQPTLWPALAFGAVTVAAPFLLMQPGFGMGIAASRTAHPTQARVRSLVTHLVFGAGLYLAATLMQS